MTLDGDVHRFAPRTIYYFNQGCVHAAINPGGAPRIHLVWDLLLTRQVFELMFGDTPAPSGLQRLASNARAVRSLAQEPMHRFARMPPRVTPLEAERLALSPVQ